MKKMMVSLLAIASASVLCVLLASHKQLRTVTPSVARTQEHERAVQRPLPSTPRSWRDLAQKTQRSTPAPRLVEPAKLPDAPTALEAAAFQENYARWMSERQDVQETQAARRYLELLLEEHDIHPLHTFFGCGASICRLQVSFSTVLELRDMANIPLEGAEVSVGSPEPVSDGVTLVVYWDRSENSPTGAGPAG